LRSETVDIGVQMERIDSTLVIKLPETDVRDLRLVSMVEASPTISEQMRTAVAELIERPKPQFELFVTGPFVKVMIDLRVPLYLHMLEVAAGWRVSPATLIRGAIRRRVNHYQTHPELKAQMARADEKLTRCKAEIHGTINVITVSRH
jgi:hypothetical protein